MSMSVGSANSMLLRDWTNVVKDVREAMQSSKKSGMAAYYQAVQNCDKAMENVMDKHHESVAKSAKKMKEYRQKKAREDAIRQAAMERREMNEEATVRALNKRELMKVFRMEDEQRRAMFEAVA